jgi:hypothetical protein
MENEDYPQLSVEDVGAAAPHLGADLTPEDVSMTAKTAPKREAPPATAEDIAKSIGSQGVLGLTADVGALPSLPRTIGNYIGEKMGFMPSEEERIQQQLALDKQIAERQAAHEGSWWQKNMPAALQPQFSTSGNEIERAYRGRFPTSEELESKITTAIPALGYEPKSKEARKAGELARAATAMIPGPATVPGVVGRMAAGAAGRAAGQQAKELQERTGFFEKAYEPYIEPLVSVVGTMGTMSLGSGIKRLALPSKAADETIASKMAEDIRAGRVKQEDIDRAFSSDTPTSLADIFGPDTAVHKFVQQQAGLAGEEGKNLLAKYNSAIGKDMNVLTRVPEAQGRIASFVRNFTDTDAPTAASVTEKANNITRGIMYDAVRKDPTAQAIPLAALGADVAGNDLVRQSMAAVTGAAATAPKAWGVVPPKTIPKTPPTPVMGANGQPLLDASGQPIMRAAVGAVETPGNLAFYDLVKRDMDRKIRLADNPNLESYDPLKVTSLKEARKNLVDALDNQVKSYAPTRAKAGELFGMDSAPEAGSDFYRTRMGTFDKAEAAKNFGAMGPEAKELFRTGWAHELMNDINTPGGLAKVSKNMIGDPNFQQNAKMILGDSYDAIRGKVLAENLRANAKEIKPIEAPNAIGQIAKAGGKWAALPAAFAGAGAEALTMAAMQAQFLSPGALAAVLTGAATGVVKSGAEQFAAARVANRAIPLILSEKKSDLARLSKLMDADPATAKMVGNLNAAFQSAQQSAPEGEEPATRELTIPGPGNREGRATGGAVNLMALSKAAKKHVTRSTEDLLNVDDSTVARALDIANQHI